MQRRDDHDQDHDRDQDRDADRDVTRRTHGELALRRRAGRQRWAVPDALKAEALDQLGRLLARGTDREELSAARTLAVLDRIDQVDERQELERTRVEIKAQARQGYNPATADPRVAEVALRAASEYVHRHEGRELED